MPRITQSCDTCLRAGNMRCSKVRPVCGRCSNNNLQCSWTRADASQQAAHASQTPQGSQQQAVPTYTQHPNSGLQYHGQSGMPAVSAPHGLGPGSYVTYAPYASVPLHGRVLNSQNFNGTSANTPLRPHDSSLTHASSAHPPGRNGSCSICQTTPAWSLFGGRYLCSNCRASGYE